MLVTLLLCHLYYDSHPLWKLRTVIEQEQITDSFHSEMVNGPTNLMIREKHYQASNKTVTWRSPAIKVRDKRLRPYMTIYILMHHDKTQAKNN